MLMAVFALSVREITGYFATTDAIMTIEFMLFQACPA
jgi:hypothetical protein